LLDKVRQQLPELKIVLDTSELQFESGDPTIGERFYIVKLVRVKVNGHDAIDGIMEDATSLRQANLKIHQLNEELEQKIIERTTQLEEANDALETFGFSVSHDLREPLRTIQGYAVALRQDMTEGNTKDFQFYVERIEAITRRIDQMVNDLLEFARLSRADIPVENIAVLDAINEAQSTLMSDQAYRSADITLEVPEGLIAKAHRLVLAQAITNLISNAVKFVQPGNKAAAVVVARSNDARIRIEVQDSGIGIEPQAQERIFNVFERLHGEEEYPGTGIGLAIVKKGIERMSGEVGVESAPGAGSTFWIELPSA
jgi:signal transduction histidine kinase